MMFSLFSDGPSFTHETEIAGYCFLLDLVIRSPEDHLHYNICRKTTFEELEEATDLDVNEVKNSISGWKFLNMKSQKKDTG